MKLVSAIFACILLVSVGARTESADDVKTIIQGRHLAEQILEQRPAESSTNTGILKIREANGKTFTVPIKIEIAVTTTNWQSIYTAFYSNTTETLTITCVASKRDQNTIGFPEASTIRSYGDELAPLYKVEHVYPTPIGSRVVFPDVSKNTFANSDFWVCDLGLEFFHWPQQKILPKPTPLVRGREYTLLESTNPNLLTNPVPFYCYSRVRSWIDQETGGLLQAEAYDANGKLLKEFAPKSFKKVNGQWQLQEMEIRNVQTGSRTRLEFDLNQQ